MRLLFCEQNTLHWLNEVCREPHITNYPSRIIQSPKLFVILQYLGISGRGVALEILLDGG